MPSTNLLTVATASNYGRDRAIIRAVKTVGQAIEAMRGTRKPVDLARAAFPDEGDAKKRETFANYLSRIENGRGDPGLRWYRQFATALGFTGPEQLGQFFTELERVQNDTKSSETTLTIPKVATNNPPSSDVAHGGGDDVGRQLFPQSDPTAYYTIVGHALVEAGSRLIRQQRDEAPEPDPAVAKPPRPKPSFRRSGPRHR